MYSLYIANKNYSSWSLRPWVLMRTLEIPFQEILREFSSTSNWEEFRKFSPNGMVPCLHHEKGEQDAEQVVWESLAIMEYLADEHEGVWPENRQARAWARSAAAEMHAGFTNLRTICPMNCGVRVRLHDIPTELQHDLNRLDELWCEGLQRFSGPFLAGDKFTAVDAFYAPVAFRVQTFALPLSSESKSYINRLLTLPAMQEWQQAAIVEPWVEAEHERES